MVFIGYGIRDEESGWDDLKGLELEGKIVVRIYGYPGRGDTLSKGYKAFGKRVKDWETSPLSKRDEWLKDALAVIDIPEYSDPQARWVKNDPDEEKPDFYEGDKKYNPYDGMMQLASDSLKRNPLEISVSKRAWAVLNENSGIDIEAYKKAAAELKNQKPVDIPNKIVEVRTTVESEIIRTRNVVGIVKGVDTTRCIVIGAHYDHLAPWEGMIFNGADDNASGTVAVMTLAKAFADNGEKPAKTLVFAAWSAEEKGLIGSEYYVEHPILPMAQTDLYVNFDMISRNSPKDTLGTGYSFSYFKGSEQLKEITSKNNEDFNIGLNIRYRPGTGKSGGSDHVPFAKKDVPYMYSMAGFHTDYHTPFDEVYKCDVKKMTKIIQLNYLNVWDALQWPARKN